MLVMHGALQHITKTCNIISKYDIPLQYTDIFDKLQAIFGEIMIIFLKNTQTNLKTHHQSPIKKTAYRQS
ncbi:hypothetical protein [Moraxella cuniculi]|nr:hypothetical protein [Moraxella cuniculi]OOS07892.1 hypothetical protein B0189_00605 [Moraxella cuniculi]